MSIPPAIWLYYILTPTDILRCNARSIICSAYHRVSTINCARCIYTIHRQRLYMNLSRTPLHGLIGTVEQYRLAAFRSRADYNVPVSVLNSIGGLKIMPVLDVVFVGKLHLPEIGGGPIMPPWQPPGIWGPP